MNYERLSKRMTVVMLLLVALMAGMPAFATTTGTGTGTVLPWETPSGLIAQSLAGPTAASVGVVAIIVCIFVMIWHPDFGAFGKVVMFIAVALSVALAANRFILGAFGVSGALI